MRDSAKEKITELWYCAIKYFSLKKGNGSLMGGELGARQPQKPSKKMLYYHRVCSHPDFARLGQQCLICGMCFEEGCN